jgi:predicted permease
MHEYLQILGNVIPLFALMAVGAAVRRIGILTESADRSLVDLCVHLLLPCLILDHVMANEALRRSGNLLWSPFLGFTVTAVGIGIAWVAAKLYRFPHAAQTKTFGYVAGIYNYGYIPVPLVATLFGTNALGVLFVYNLGTETAFWLVGFALLTGHTIWSDWRRALTSPVRAVILGVTINLTTAAFGLRLDDATLDTLAWGWPVKVVFDTIHLIGDCSIPIALIVIGATMSDFWGEFKRNPGPGVMTLGVFVRNFVAPAMMVLVAWLVPVSLELKETIVVQAAMPAGVFTLMLSRHNGGSVPVALQVIFSSSAAALITLPLWVHFGLLLIGTAK